MFVSATSAFNFKDKYKNKDWAKYEEKGGDKDKDEETQQQKTKERRACVFVSATSTFNSNNDEDRTLPDIFLCNISLEGVNFSD